MTSIKPVVCPDAPCEQGWDDEQTGSLYFRTIFSAGQTPTEALTAGVSDITPGNALKLHRHPQPEIYHLVAGEGIVTIDGDEYPVQTGSSVFIPGNAVHGIRNTGQSTLRFFYVFATDSFDNVQYTFTATQV